MCSVAATLSNLCNRDAMARLNLEEKNDWWDYKPRVNGLEDFKVYSLKVSRIILGIILLRMVSLQDKD